LLTVTSARAQWYQNGNTLLEICESQNGGDRIGCNAYLEGIVDAIEGARVARGFSSCLRGGVQVNQVRDVVVTYLKTNASKRDVSAGWLASWAIEEAWCPEKPQVTAPTNKPLVDCK
jgi:hypothetical protein